ncbi:COQ9-domain-containing protein [Podospora aff. communis PSN243]|uniref:Ubiquinone biosynthesis protein n=1 Tax=Podospora aff. communis PSN243 TaxID=3040156 RepID=A0AAV9GWG0_9PEZI|nr:COQ9-domain-containing protein [Podospora aff. communis PSN243]
MPPKRAAIAQVLLRPSAVTTAASHPLRALRAGSIISRAPTSPSPRTGPTPRSLSISPSRPRQYHSTTHPPPPSPFTPTESAILSAAYAHVPTHGFTPSSLALGARAAGYLDISTSIFPEGAFSLIRWHLYTQRTALAGKKDSIAGFESMGLTERVEALTWERLIGNKDVVGRWQEALAIMAQPTYVPASVKELAQLADEIWYLAGDVSVDPTWYTKRASLSAIYAASELFMTNDRSPDFSETRQFLRRRLSEAGEIGDATSSVREWLSFTASAGVNVLRSKGVPI